MCTFKLFGSRMHVRQELDAIDRGVLKKLATKGVAALRTRYPANR